MESYRSQLRPEEKSDSPALAGGAFAVLGGSGPILDWNAAERRVRRNAFLRDDVFPRRQAMLEIAGRIASINEQQLNTGNDLVVSLLVKFQARLAVTLLATLALGLGMAAFSTRKILNLEASANAQYQAVADAREQLKDLSARLVQAEEAERRTLSRELHDEVGQSLSAVLVELRNLSAGLDARSEEQTRSQAELIRGLVESAIRVVRNMALLLRPSMLDDLGPGSGSQMAGARGLQTHLHGCQRRRRYRLRRLAGRVQNLRLPRSPGGPAQLLATFPRPPLSASACSRKRAAYYSPSRTMARVST